MTATGQMIARRLTLDVSVVNVKSLDSYLRMIKKNPHSSPVNVPEKLGP